MNKAKESKYYAKFLIVLAFLIVLTPSVHAFPTGSLLDGLISYYTMDTADRDGNNVSDYTNRNNMTGVNTPTYDVLGVDGQAIFFPGVNQYLIAVDSASLEPTTNNITIAFWMKRNEIDEIQSIGGRWQGAGNYVYYLTLSADNKLIFGLINSSGSEGSWTSTDTFTDVSNFHHYIFEFQGGNYYVYQDNVLLDGTATGGITTINTGANAALTIGETVADGRYFNGTIDEFGLWNRTLTDVERNQVYINNVTLSSYDSYLSNYIYNFSVIINGTTYDSNVSTGLVVTPYNHTDTRLFNITFTGPYYQDTRNESVLFNANYKFYPDYNMSRHLIKAYEAVSPYGQILNFSIITTEGSYANTTNGSLIIPTLWNTSSDITFFTSEFGNLYSNFTYTTNGSQNEAYNFSIYNQNSFYFTFYDEITGANLSGTSVSLELISDEFGNNYSTSTGNLSLSLLVPANYLLRYSATDYFERTYYITLTNGSYNFLNLYLLNSTYPSLVDADGVLITVKDNVNSEIEGAIINVNKYFVENNSFITVERLITNFEGKANSHLTNDEFYRFIIEYPDGTVKLSTTSTKIFDTTLTFILSLVGDPTLDFKRYGSISSSMQYINSSNNFVFTYTDSELVGSQYCLAVYQNKLTENVLIDSSCSSSSSGTIIVGITPDTEAMYTAQGYVIIDGVKTILQLKTVNFMGGESFDYGNNGLLIVIILTLIFAFIGIYSPIIMLILTPLPLLIGSIVGFVNISVGVAVAVCVAFMVVVIMIGRRA